MVFAAIFLALFALLWGVFLLITPLLQRLLKSLANKTTSFRYKDYVPVILLVSGAAVLAAVAGDAFLDLAELVHAQSPVLQRLDNGVHDWAGQERSPGATAFFVALSMIGGPVGLAVIVAAVSAVLLVQRRYRWVAYLLFTSFVGALLNLELKTYFARARPDLAAALRRAHGYSFPSGHAMGATIVSGALAYLAFRAIRSYRGKTAALAAGTTFAIAVASSRVYLGVHWISDVSAGITIGALWVIATTIAYESSRRIRLIRAIRKKRE